MLLGSNAVLKPKKFKKAKQRKKKKTHNSVMGGGGGLSDLGSDVWPCRRNSYRKASSPPGMVPKGLRQ